MQRSVMMRPWVRTVAISQSLVTCLENHHGIQLHNPLVLHDAAPDSIKPISVDKRRVALADLLKEGYESLANWRVVCGYFGQLYDGRGIEIIESIAKARPDCLFLVYGGTEDAIRKWHTLAPDNLRFMGQVPHPQARNVQVACDILLMPYQNNVSIGIHGHDTARWMSPMKMFEYMASGVPIISSDIPVLREVLSDGFNALLVEPGQPNSWINALDYLIKNSQFAAKIGRNAHADYQQKYTWSRRAEALLEAAKIL
jgi:glycosyltransferase involved in cell wall biosynthesis